jgi:hypothetical protein
MIELEVLNLENKKLIQDIIALHKEVMNVELIHYKSRDIEQAKKRNIEFLQIKNFLQDRFDDMYDL